RQWNRQAVEDLAVLDRQLPDRRTDRFLRLRVGHLHVPGPIHGQVHRTGWRDGVRERAGLVSYERWRIAARLEPDAYAREAAAGLRVDDAAFDDSRAARQRRNAIA